MLSGMGAAGADAVSSVTSSTLALAAKRNYEPVPSSSKFTCHTMRTSQDATKAAETQQTHGGL